MAELKVTHIGKFFQEFSHPIPNLKELRDWTSALDKWPYQIIRVTLSVTLDARTAREGLNYDPRWGVVPPYNPFRFLRIS